MLMGEGAVGAPPTSQLWLETTGGTIGEENANATNPRAASRLSGRRLEFTGPSPRERRQLGGSTRVSAYMRMRAWVAPIALGARRMRPARRMGRSHTRNRHPLRR